MLQPNATREEVLAAVEEHEKRVNSLMEQIERGDTEGVVICGRDWTPYEHPTLARQRIAGEEDQSVPGWDQGA